MGDLRDRVQAINCGSWKELINRFEDLSSAVAGNRRNHWIYRGNAEANWWLKPSIEVFQESLTARASIRKLERQFLYDFRSLAPQFLGNLANEQETLEWLAILQHYGTPTRLLDWTYSPTVATYFALRETPNKDCPSSGYACIWALNLRKLTKCVIDQVQTKDWQKAYYKALSQVANGKGPAYVTPFLPRNRYSRMSSQQGLFLVKTVAELPFMKTLDSMYSLTDGNFIRRLIVPHSQRVTILAHLLEHNTHEVGLFPDADGLGRFVRTKAEVQSQTLGLD